MVKEKELEKVRTKNISLRATLKKLEQTMVKKVGSSPPLYYPMCFVFHGYEVKSLINKEELGDGLHLIDFEQLKIENQAYNEKIEERYD